MVFGTIQREHDSTPSVAGPTALLASAARTADVSVDFEPAIGVEQLLFEVDVTSVTLTPAVTLELRAIMPSGALVVLGTATAAIAATGSFTYGFGLGADAALTEKFARIMLGGLAHRVTMNHADADSITYSVTMHVF